jgi:hypothetical protein
MPSSSVPTNSNRHARQTRKHSSLDGSSGEKAYGKLACKQRTTLYIKSIPPTGSPGTGVPIPPESVVELDVPAKHTRSHKKHGDSSIQSVPSQKQPPGDISPSTAACEVVPAVVQQGWQGAVKLRSRPVHRGSPLPTSSHPPGRSFQDMSMGKSQELQEVNRAREVSATLQGRECEEGGATAPEGSMLDPAVLQELVTSGCTSWDALTAQLRGIEQTSSQPLFRGVKPVEQMQPQAQSKSNVKVVKKHGFVVEVETDKDALLQKRSVTASAKSFLDGLEKRRKRDHRISKA